MKKVMMAVMAVVCLSCQPISYAALHIELTQGMSSAIPIAIVPFKGQSADSNDSKNVASVIQSDLQNSGQFKVQASNFKQFPSSPSEVNMDAWKDVSANDLVVGSVTPAGGGQFKVNFSLMPLNQSDKPTVIASDSFTVPASQLRKTAHRISDLIYQKLTGKRGVFSTRIAYVLVEGDGDHKRYMLEVSDADGFNPRPIVVSNEPLMSPNWSPDGRKIAYVSFENRKASIYISDVASGGRQQVSSFPGINGAPHFSPDGNKLALALSMDGMTPNIYTMNLATKALTQLTNDGSINTEPAWAPNGSQIVFTSNRGGGPQIYKLDIGSRSTTRISFDGHYNATPSLTSDGKTLVVLHGEGGNNYDVATIDLDSGATRVVTQTGAVSAPSVAPNGQMVVYADISSGRGSLGIVSIDGKIKLNLPSPVGSVREPAWSPFLG